MFFLTQVPWMPDEMVFQKARSIVIAFTQKIMYNDWLPIILGRESVVREGIYVSQIDKLNTSDGSLRGGHM